MTAEEIQRKIRFHAEEIVRLTAMQAGGAQSAPAETKNVPDDLIEIQEATRVAKMSRSRLYEFLEINRHLVWKRDGKNKSFVSKGELKEAVFKKSQFRTP